MLNILGTVASENGALKSYLIRLLTMIQLTLQVPGMLKYLRNNVLYVHIKILLVTFTSIIITVLVFILL